MPMNIQGLICKELKRQDKLPEKWNDMALDPRNKDVGKAYYLGKEYDSDVVIDANTTKCIYLYRPGSTSSEDRGSYVSKEEYNKLAKGFEFITELDLVSDWTSSYSSELIDCSIGVANYIEIGNSTVASAGSSAKFKGVKGHYKFRITCAGAGKTAYRHYSYNGGDWISLGSLSEGISTKWTQYTQAEFSVGCRYVSSKPTKSKIRFSLKGTKLTLTDGEVLFYRDFVD